MSEFDIRIGTQLDTSKALQELMDFVKKYSGKESISIDLGQVKGAGNIKNTTKALQGIQKIAKEIGNTKIDVSKMLGSTTDSVAKGLDKTVGDTAKKLSIAVDRTRRDLVSDATKGIANTTKNLNNEIKDIERSIKRLSGNFNSAKKMQFIDKDSIEKGLSDLNKMGQIKIDISNMNEVKQNISNLGKFLDKTIREANNNAWKENVGSAKINGLLENLKSVQTVMSAKNMDTSGIDDLVDRTGKLMSLPIGELVQQYAQIRKEFSKELVIPLSVKGVINAETAVKSILSYKDDLVKQIAIETDNTKVKQLQEIVQQIDDTVVKLNADLGTVGRSTVKNLIDSSNEKTADNLVKKYDELGNKIEKLNNPKNLTNVKLDDLTNIKKSYEDIGKIVNDVNFNKLDGSKINEVANDISNLKRIVEDTSESAKKLSIKAQIDVGLKNAEQMLLGMESALVQTGKRTGVLNKLKTGLQEAMDTIKLDPSKGLSSLNDVIKAIGDQAVESGLKNITGGLQQYEKYINEYTSLMKKASNTKDLGLAKTYEQEANRTLKALNILEKGMTQSQIGTTNALKFEAQTKASEGFTNSILKTASAVNSYKKELQGVNKEVGFDKLVSQAGEKARQEYEGLIDSTNKMQSKLSKMLSSDKVDTGGLAKLNAELKENKSNLDKFKNTSINIKCKEAIADLKELRKEEEKLGHNVSGIDSNIKRIGELQSQLSKGLIGSNQVSKEIYAIEKEHSSMAKLTKKVNDAQKEYKKLVDTVSGLKQNGKLENSVFNSLDKQAENLKGKFTNLNFGTLTAVEVSKITGAVEKFASSVNNAKATDLHLRLKADFDIDASKANVKINGLESALLANGEDTKVVKSLRNKLKKYIETAVDDPALASKGVAGLLDNIANATASKDLGKITGDLAQYKKYISEIESLSSKASKTTDEALAKKYQNQDKALRSALAKLESGFDEKTLKTATTLRDNAFDGISDNIAKEVDKVKDKINEYKTTMQNATKGYDVSKFTSNIGKGLAEQFDQGISKADELEAKLNEILSSKNVDVSALTKIRNEIENLQKSTSGFKTSIADTFIRESFDNIQIPDLSNILQAVKDVMSAKNIDTSGIDKLIAKTKDLANVDVSRLSSEFKAIQDELSKEVEIRLGAKGVKTVEDVLNVILKHRNELEKQISMEVDSSKVKQLNSELEKTNKVINSLGGKTGSLGGALIGNADVSNVKQLESALGNVEKRYDNLASKANKLQGNKFVDISELRNTLELSESIKKSLNDVKVNPSSSGISKLNSELSKLEQTIKNTEQNAKNIKLGIKFDGNLETAGNMINGIEASLIKLGDTSRESANKLNEFKSKFESIKQYSKINLSGAISQLDDLIGKMKEFGSKNALGDISGTISQVKQLGKELQNALSGQLKAGTSDTASKFEQEASRIESAMKRLTSTMKETQRESANAFNNNSFNNFSSKMDSEASKVDSSINKIKSSLQNLKEVVNFKDLKLDGAKFEMAKIIEQEIDKTIQKAEELKSRLREVMSSDMSASAKTSEITRLKEEMAQLEQQANSLKEKSIIIKCSDSIQQLEQLKNKMREAGQDTSGIDKLSDKFRALAGKLSSGELGVDKAVAELKKLDTEANNAGTGFEKLQSRVQNMSTRIQGFFGSIKNAFSSFTLGSMISRSIYSAVNEIKTTITDLDSAFANFSRVAPDNFTINTGNLEQVAGTAKQIAIDVGQSTSDVINAMSTALQVI